MLNYKRVLEPWKIARHHPTRYWEAGQRWTGFSFTLRSLRICLYGDMTCDVACFPNQYAKASLPGTRKSHFVIRGNIISTCSWWLPLQPPKNMTPSKWIVPGYPACSLEISIELTTHLSLGSVFIRMPEGRHLCRTEACRTSGASSSLGRLRAPPHCAYHWEKCSEVMSNDAIVMP